MVEFLPKNEPMNGSKHCDLAPLFNTEIYPFSQKYCDILAKSFNNGLYGNIFKKKVVREIMIINIISLN